ncbi:uncharacterized protein LOC103861089 [Brassica rapa]|uniref:uncharacterized protein LOC103861089 n=1 Tax=Brassica campestris TaxID=3711 RepID=UPI0004F14527|nr:uncharacterized protein LOC103861089 [Brassica rapa]
MIYCVQILFPRGCFWDVSDTGSGSWIWRKLLKLRQQAATFLRSSIGNGKNTLFWFDNWVDMGKLIDVAGDSETQALGISRYATVASAATSGRWNIRRCRSSHLRAMIARINDVPAPVEDADSDQLLWRHGEDDHKTWFSSSSTWDQVRMKHPKVTWNELIWFPQAIPRCSFIAWLAILNRLSTGDRTQAWGEIQQCRLCGEPQETRDHLFFACPYTYTVWTETIGSLLPRPNPDWSITITMLLFRRRSASATCLLRLSFQTVIHSIWRERNSRKHNGKYRTAAELTHMIDKMIRNRISSLRSKNMALYSTVMMEWMGRAIS